MSQPTPQTVIPIADPQPSKPDLGTFFTATYERVNHILTVAIPAVVITPIRNFCGHYYQRLVTGGEVVVMPQSALAFIITALLALAEIKSQYQSQPLPIVFSVGCLLIFGLANAAEVVVACAGLAPTSVYAVIAHLGKFRRTITLKAIATVHMVDSILVDH